MRAQPSKKPINPAVAWIVIAVVIVLAVVLYMTLGSKPGGHQLTQDERARAAQTIKQMEQHGLVNPAARKPGMPQPFARPGAGAGAPGAGLAGR